MNLVYALAILLCSCTITVSPLHRGKHRVTRHYVVRKPKPQPDPTPSIQDEVHKQYESIYKKLPVQKEY